MSNSEQGTCQVCGKENNGIQRTYYYYGIKCECHSPEHFEIVYHCNTCVPNPPSKTTLNLSPTTERQLSPQFTQPAGAEVISIDELLSEFKRQGFDTSNWEGDEGAEKAIVDGVVNHINSIPLPLSNDAIETGKNKPFIVANVREILDGDFTFSRMVELFNEVAERFYASGVTDEIKNEWSEMQRLYDWIMDENREPSLTFFTSGQLRNVAYEIEYRLHLHSRTPGGKGYSLPGQDEVTKLLDDLIPTPKELYSREQIKQAGDDGGIEDKDIDMLISQLPDLPDPQKH